MLSLPSRVAHRFADQSPPGPVNCVRFNSSGEYAMTAGNDKTIKLWNVSGVASDASHGDVHAASQERLVKTYAGHGYEVLALAITADDARFASSGGDKLVYYWDVVSSKIVRKFAGHFQRVNCVAFNADGSVLASGSYDASVRLWDCRSHANEPIQVLKEPRDSVTSIVIRGHELLVGSVDGVVRNYDLRAGLIHADTLGHPVTSARFSRDGNCVLVSSLDDTVRLLDKETGDLLNEYTGHKNNQYRLESCLSNTDAHVITGSEDGHIYCYDLVDATLVRTLRGHTRSVLSVDYHPKDEAVLISGSSDGTVIVWRQSDEEKGAAMELLQAGM